LFIIQKEMIKSFFAASTVFVLATALVGCATKKEYTGPEPAATVVMQFHSFDPGTVTIKAGETRVIEECDLSSYYYLRRPGQYSVAFRSDGLPSSNTLHFQVSGEEDLARDGDPMGKLLPRVVGKWTPQGSPNQSPRLRPGRNRVEVLEDRVHVCGVECMADP